MARAELPDFMYMLCWKFLSISFLLNRFPPLFSLEWNCFPPFPALCKEIQLICLANFLWDLLLLLLLLSSQASSQRCITAFLLLLLFSQDLSLLRRRRRRRRGRRLGAWGWWMRSIAHRVEAKKLREWELAKEEWRRRSRSKRRTLFSRMAGLN